VGNPALSGELSLAKTHPWGGHYLFRMGTHNGKYGMYIYIDNIPYDVAKQLDQKYDDGINTTGAIRSNRAYTETVLSRLTWTAF